MGMSDSKSSIDRKFREIVQPQIRPEMANTLANFLWAAPGQHKPTDSAVRYVLERLWVDLNDPRKGPS